MFPRRVLDSSSYLSHLAKRSSLTCSMVKCIRMFKFGRNVPVLKGPSKNAWKAFATKTAIQGRIFYNISVMESTEKFEYDIVALFKVNA